MNKIGVDLVGEIVLYKENGRKSPVIQDLWGIANLRGETRKDSYYIYLIDNETLEVGQKSQAEFKFKFSDDERFKIKVCVGQVIELSSGFRKTGEFRIQKIINRKLE